MKGGQQMGCFDFTYADNGENIYGRNGYIYLSPQVAEKINLPNPLRFCSTDAYGHFRLRIKGYEKYSISIDIFALYAVLTYVDKNEMGKDKQLSYLIDNFLTKIHDRQFDSEYEELNDMLRNTGTDHFYHNFEYKVDSFKITVPKLGNQKEKHLETNEVCWAETPLLISRKKLPVDVNTSLKEMAQTWGFVSTYDPKQGLFVMRNQYCKYIAK
jgi:hypothetical protein